VLFSLKLRYARLRYLVSVIFARLMGRQYIVYSTPSDFKWLLMRKHNQRRERGNVARFLRQRRGSYNATR
jgi:hypothetical protein